MKQFFSLILIATLAFSCNAQTVSNQSAAFVQKLNQSPSESTIIFDVRTEQEWTEGVIANAELVNFYSDSFIEDVKAKIGDNTKQVVFVCRSGGRSSSAAGQVSKLFPNLEVINMEGGMNAWNKNNYPTVSYSK